jgi:hypothetical protein
MTVSLDLSAIGRIGRRYRGRLEEADPELTLQLDISSRLAYLDWVGAWKLAYRELSGQIRGHKADVRAAGSNIPLGLSFIRADERDLARALLTLRHLGKRLSWERALAARAERSEVAV